MQTLILRNNVLTDNTLLLSNSGKVFKGGYKAIIKEYTYLNAWSDKEKIKRFRKIDALKLYLAKNYTQTEIENLEY
jgi:hypothetical protein